MADEAKLPQDKVLQVLQYQGSGIVNTFDEVQALLITVVWHPSLLTNPDTAPGLIIFPKSSKLDPGLVLDCVRQQSKLSTLMLKNMTDWATQAKQQQEKIRELEAQVRSYQGQGVSKAEAAGPDDSSTVAGRIKRALNPE